MAHIAGRQYDASAPRKSRRQRGVALLLALFILVTLSMLGAAMIVFTQTEMWTTLNYRLATQSRYAAEAGAQQAANWLNQSYTAPTDYTKFVMSGSPLASTTFPVQDSTGHNAIILSADPAVTSNYPVASVQTAFSTALQSQSVAGMTGASYVVSAKLLSMTQGSPPAQLWEITSKGSVAGVRTTQVQVVERIERVAGNSMPMYAAFATSNNCNSLLFSGAVTTDSFNSATGTYAATHTNANANMGTNGSLLASGGITVHGSYQSPLPATKGACPSNSYNYSGTGTFDSGAQQISAVTYPPAPAPTGTSTSASQNVANCSAFASGCSGSAGNIVLAPGTYNALLGSGSANVHLSAGTYNFYSFTFSGSISIVIDSGPVTINFPTASSSPIIASGSWLVNSGGKSTDLRINYGGTGSIPLSGSTGTYGLVYAPNATIAVSGGTDWYGMLLASTITTSGAANFHYDQALSALFNTTSKYHVTWFTWSKY